MRRKCWQWTSNVQGVSLLIYVQSHVLYLTLKTDFAEKFHIVFRIISQRAFCTNTLKKVLKMLGSTQKNLLSLDNHLLFFSKITPKRNFWHNNVKKCLATLLEALFEWELSESQNLIFDQWHVELVFSCFLQDPRHFWFTSQIWPACFLDKNFFFQTRDGKLTIFNRSYFDTDGYGWWFYILKFSTIIFPVKFSDLIALLEVTISFGIEQELWLWMFATGEQWDGCFVQGIQF